MTKVENRNKLWTKEDDDYLLTNFETRSIESIAKKLKRTPLAIKRRIKRIFGTNNKVLANGYLSATDISRIFGVGNYSLGKWVEHFNLPAKKFEKELPKSYYEDQKELVILKRSLKTLTKDYSKENDKKLGLNTEAEIKQIELEIQEIENKEYFKNGKCVYGVTEEDFWEWLKEHRNSVCIDTQKAVLGELLEPDWFLEDYRNKVKYGNKVRWTKEEENLLWQYYTLNYSVPKIAELMGRNKSSVSRKLNRLIKVRMGLTKVAI